MIFWGSPHVPTKGEPGPKRNQPRQAGRAVGLLGGPRSLQSHGHHDWMMIWGIPTVGKWLIFFPILMRCLRDMAVENDEHGPLVDGLFLD